ncbi:MAG TPA: TPM domain-containing protein [Bacteroidota bacterium]|nr:TPM domain-containing protein [Bacteroidota bacterium]
MPLTRRVLAACFALFLSAAAARGEADVPLLSGRITDNAALLSPETVSRLTALLRMHEDSTSNQVAVLTIPSLEGEPIESYSIRVAEAWKLGTKEKDNGVLLIVARDDRKVRIEVGRGLEGNLPDITSGRIIRSVMIPHFRTGDYDGGISAGVEAILASLQGSYTAPPGEDRESADIGTRLMAGAIFTVVVGLFTIIALFSRGAQAWFLYFFLLPFWLMFPLAIIGVTGGAIAFGCYALFVPLFRLWWSRTEGGKSLHTKITGIPFFAALAASASSSGGGSSWSSGGSSFGSSGSSFSGGGGGFSGGGASGSW